MPSSRAARLISEVGRRFDDHFANVVGKIQQLGDRRTAVIAAAGTFQASGALVKSHVPHTSGSSPDSFSTSGGIVTCFLQFSQINANQALRHDAIQRRNEIVRLDAHVDEAADHVGHVVGVNRGENQMAGERRVDGDLRGFLVANFADHDLVGVVTQNGTQAAGEREALFSLTGICVMPRT